MIKKKFETLSHSIFLKIMFLFLIVIIPIFILGSSIYFWGYGMVKKEINNSSISQVNLYGKSIENEISRIQQLQYELVNDEDLLYLTNAYTIMDNFELGQYMLRVESRLRIMKNSSTFIENIVVHIPNLGKSISTSFGVYPLWTKWKETIQNMEQSDISGITYKSNHILMDISYPVILRENNQPLIMVEIALSNQAIKEMLTGFNQYPNGTVFLTNKNSDYLIATNHETSYPEEALNHTRNSAFGTLSISSNNTPALVTYSNLQLLDMQLISIVPTNYIFNKIQHYKVFFLCFMIVSVIVFIIFALLIKILIHMPIRNLIKAINELEFGNFDISVAYIKNDEFRYLYQAFNDMAKNIKELIQQVYEQKILTQKAELKQLQSQINPHFLYNSFFNIYRMSKNEDYENITSFTQYLGSYYQYVTRNATESVTLFEEYEHSKTYLNIQSMRFHNILTIAIDDLPSDAKNLLVPRLIIQPVIENAFQHGFKEIENPIIYVTCDIINNILSISVEDNGSSLNEEDFHLLKNKLKNRQIETETTGIVNIHRRLQYKFGDESGISLSHSNLSGLKVTINLPLGSVKGGISHE